MYAISDAALFNMLTTRTPTATELVVRRRVTRGEIEPMSERDARALLIALYQHERPTDRPMSHDTMRRIIARGNAVAGGEARIASPARKPRSPQKL